MSEAAAAQARFRARVPFAPLLLEGDLFSSALEGPASFRVGGCNGTPGGTALPDRVSRAHLPPMRPRAATARHLE